MDKKFCGLKANLDSDEEKKIPSLPVPGIEP
jgi:hypothetical protein